MTTINSEEVGGLDEVFAGIVKQSHTRYATSHKYHPDEQGCPDDRSAFSKWWNGPRGQDERGGPY